MRNMQKIVRNIARFVFLSAMIGSVSLNSVFAEVSWYEAGLVGDKLVSGEYEYMEYTFVTGKPILLKGTIKKPAFQSMISAEKNFKMNYSYHLENEDASIVVDRKVSFDIQVVRNEELGQVELERKLASYDETITVPEGQYSLGKANYLESRICDVNAASSYSSGNGIFERTFYLNGNHMKNDGVLTIDTEIRPIIAYENNFSRNESFVVDQYYDMKPGGVKNAGTGGGSTGGSTSGSSKSTGSGGKKDTNKGFSGSVKTGLNSTAKTIFDYQHTDPQNISFRGSYFKYKSEENSLVCSSDFLVGGKRKKDTKRLSNNTVYESKAMYIPVFRDMAGHRLEKEVGLLTSMGIFDQSRHYFIPDASISRHEFAKALYIALHGTLETPSKSDEIKRKRPGVETPFVDISVDHPDYHYIEAYKKAGIAEGRHHYLKPEEPILKSEAIVMIISALGLDKVAPNPKYQTIFADDAQIDEWAKDGFYMALEIGLIGGTDTTSIAQDALGTYDYGSGVELYASPNEYVSRAQAAQLIERLINHLNERMIPDYREYIIK